MTTASLSPVFEHLWQSTLFAAAAALLAFALHNKRAHVRYCVWLAASLKLLVPFSLFVAIGSQIEWTPAASPAMSMAVKQIAEPLQALPVFFSAAQTAAAQTTSRIPIILFAIWVCGFLAVLLIWSQRWLRVRAAVTLAVPLSLETPIPALSSAALMEPGVFGIFRPILLLPAGITSHLTRAHLEAILAHELCHVRRRDNLAAAVHMLVEALFWFHPLVWWIGARLVEERERACDEEVVRQGNQPQIYAESILKTCQFCLESPLACVSGVTGSDLKKRIVHIMTGEAMSRLNIVQRILLAATAAGAVALPLTVGLAQTPQTSAPAASFEVASIKPSKPGTPGPMIRLAPGSTFSATGINVKLLLEEAYGVKDPQVSQGPPWLDSERFDIDAKPDESTAAAMEKLPFDQRKDKLMQMIQTLLTERFKLELGHETKDLPVYALVVAKDGPKLKQSTFNPSDRPTAPPPMPKEGPPKGGPRVQGFGGLRMGPPGHMVSTGVDLSMFAGALSRVSGRIVIDKTGLSGRYDFVLQWTPDENQGPMFPGEHRDPSAGAPPPESSGPSLFTAIQEQLGLKLESEKAPMPFLVIKHIEKPSEN